MTIAQTQNEIIEEFSFFEDWEDKYKLIIDKAKRTPEFPSDQRIAKNKIDGCQSQVWFFSKYENGKVILFADSDAILVKGIAAILVEIYSDHAPEEILAEKPFFIEKIGISDHLSPSRKNGLVAMLKQIQLYAIAYKTLG
jgi:cysteine desulfuration protein SufE